MDVLSKLLHEMPLPDWAALVFYFAGWVGYAVFARRRSRRRPSVLGATNLERTRWMRQVTLRDNRIVDGGVVQALSSSPSFFASTTILIIGGLFAVLSSAERVADLVHEIPFAAHSTVLIFDLKILLLLATFIYAFFRFTWSLRQYGFGALLVGSAPHPEQFADDTQRDAFAQRAGRVMGLAAESFNDGLRAYYMSFAACAWFLSPWALIVGMVCVVTILFRREFESEVLAELSKPPLGA
ncbi:hypothetical protein CKO44_08510 [Rubrivivax gelatinosus]|uniref:DUF599 domain-containing protein n=1 Tax=Rubrivivax gelatinosus TaxID=28068 RepID=A0ABS1DZ57_RUBGE|nr:DUF599 domain-containing protein [Rubrivivax gelatinosus]MBK1613511.1 hypothetical protein [Rubrivivax gelatinosus]MBK1713957.1 hypothetical protein [Rubrivivax gelatinosus]